MDTSTNINDKDQKWSIHTIATKLENNCSLFDKMHALYNTRPNIPLLYKKDSTMVTNTMTSRDSMGILVTNLLSLLLNLNF